MRNLIHLCLIMSLGALLSGCATQQAPISQEAAQRIQRLAVVSVAAQVFTRKYTGMTVFGNEKDEKDISAWQIDAQYEAQITSEVERIRGVRVVQAPYQVADFMPVNNMPGVYLTGMYEGANWQAIESATKAHCAKHALDAVLLVAQTSVPDFFTGSNQTLSGAGFYVRGPIRGASVMHLSSRIGLLDCASGKPLAVRLLARSHHSRSRGGLFSLPYREISENLSRMPIASWTPEIEQQITANLIELPVQSWGPSIQSLFRP